MYAVRKMSNSLPPESSCLHVMSAQLHSESLEGITNPVSLLSIKQLGYIYKVRGHVLVANFLTWKLVFLCQHASGEKTNFPVLKVKRVGLLYVFPECLMSDLLMDSTELSWAEI